MITRGARNLLIFIGMMFTFSFLINGPRCLVERTEQDDPGLVRQIRQFYLQQPSTLPYNLTDNKLQDYSQGGQSKFLDALLNQRENGFYVESGALDGETFSNSLFFEKYRNWTGVLIEPHPDSYKILRSKNRKAVSINACLSPTSHPAQIPMDIEKTILIRPPDITSRMWERRKDKIKNVQCFPLYSILLAVGRTYIDMFSLDIEGAELDVLRSIPWTKVDIKVVLVEHEHIEEGKDALVDYMTSKGYTILPIKKSFWQDIVFVKNGLNYSKTGLN